MVSIILLSCAVALTGYSSSDESWFLRVLQRVNAGETLYRDVYYGLLPLPVYLGAPITSIFGPTFLVLQMLFFACFLSTVWICDSVAQYLKLGAIARAGLLVAICVWSSPGAINHGASLYQPLATLSMLLCVRMVLAWSTQIVKERGNVQLAIAGIAAGAGFATKDQIGALTLAALLLSVAAVAVHRRFPMRHLLRTGAVIGAIFIGTVLLTTVPVILSGGLNDLVENFMVERQAYVRDAYISYLDGIGQFLHLMADGIFIDDPHPIQVVRHSIFLIAPTALVLLIIALVRVRGEDRLCAAILFAFSMGAFLSMFPRSDLGHVLFTSAMILVGLVYSGDRLLGSPVHRNIGFGLFLAWMSIGFGSAVWKSTSRVFSGDYDFLRLPHFEFALAPRSEIDTLHRDREQLVAAAVRGPIFLLTSDAAFYYLVSQIKNPTPIDYPLRNSMGFDGEGRIIKAIQSGQIQLVCVRSYPNPRLRPLRLEEFVRREMHLVNRLRFCDLYQISD
jgi:hypothetical protein